MNELIKTETNDNGEIIVSGRELHEFLEVKTKYADWFERMCEYGFVESVDYIEFWSNPKNENAQLYKGEAAKYSPQKLSALGYEKHHALKIDMAKEVSMIQRNEKGKQARQYFIEVEKRWNDPDMIVKRAHEILERKVAKLTTQNLMLEQQINELKPKADYTDIILQNKSLMTITQIAKDYGMSGEKMNKLLHELKVQFKQGEQWFLYSKHHDKGYTHSSTMNITRKDGTPDVVLNTKWTQKGRLFIYDLLKKRDIVPMIERDYKEVN